MVSPVVDVGTADGEPAPGTPAWWEARGAVEARRRPRSDGLTLDRIVDAALVLIDREGLDALTMRRLAGELGAGAASLYRHVVNREELLVLVMDSVLGDMRPPPEGGTWRETSEWMACEFRRVLVSHRGVIPLLSQDPLLGPNAMRGREASLRMLLHFGFREDQAGGVYSMVVAWVLGFTMLVTSAAGRLTVEGTSRGDLFATFAHDYPVVQGLASEGRLPGGDEEAVFALGLATLLDGIDVRYRVDAG
jgi:AcrR family transcriptional regulator